MTLINLKPRTFDERTRDSKWRRIQRIPRETAGKFD